MLIMVDASGSAQSTISSTCYDESCQVSFLRGQFHALEEALQITAVDPQCAESYLAVSLWNDKLFQTHSWFPLSRWDKRIEAAIEVGRISTGVMASGDTLQRTSFLTATDILIAKEPAVGIIVMITDLDPPQSGWSLEWGREHAGRVGFEFFKIVVSPDMKVGDISRELLNIIEGVHSAPHLCFG